MSGQGTVGAEWVRFGRLSVRFFGLLICICFVDICFSISEVGSNNKKDDS